MSTGLRVYRQDGDLALTSGVANYVFLGKYINQTITVTSLLPPIVFSRSDTGYVATTQAEVTNLGGNSWRIEPGYWAYEVHPNNVHTLVAASPNLTMYVFVAKLPADVGTGLKVVNGAGIGMALGSAEKPLIVKKRVYLDPNTPAKALTGSYPAKHGRSINIGAPVGKWAAAVGGGQFAAVPAFGNFADILGDWQVLRDDHGSVSHVIAGIQSHVYLNGNIVTTHPGQHTGPEEGSNNQVPSYYPVWLIDTNWYG